MPANPLFEWPHLTERRRRTRCLPRWPLSSFLRVPENLPPDRIRLDAAPPRGTRWIKPTPGSSRVLLRCSPPSSTKPESPVHGPIREGDGLHRHRRSARRYRSERKPGDHGVHPEHPRRVHGTIEPPISLDSSLETHPGSKGKEALDVSESGRAGFDQESRTAGRLAEAVECAAEGRRCVAASAGRGHRRGEPGDTHRPHRGRVDGRDENAFRSLRDRPGRKQVWEIQLRRSFPRRNE